MIISTTATMEEGQRVLSWNEFQKANKGRPVTVEEWREHRRKVLSSRPVRPLVPTSVDVPSSSDTKNCDRPAGDADERHEKRDAAAARWKKLFATQSPARAEDESPGPITTQDQSVSLSSSLAKRGRPSSGRGSKGGSHRKNKRSDDGRPSTKTLSLSFSFSHTHSLSFTLQCCMSIAAYASWPWKYFSCQYTSLKNIAKQTKKK